MKTSANLIVTSAVNLTDRNAVKAYASKMFASYKGSDLEAKEDEFVTKLESFVSPEDDTTPKVILVRAELKGLNPEFMDSVASMVETLSKERTDGKIISPFSLPETCDTIDKALDYIDEHIAQGREPMMFLLSLKDAYNCVGELTCKSDDQAINIAALTLRGAIVKLELESVSAGEVYTRNGKNEKVEKSHIRSTFDLVTGSTRLESLIQAQFEEALRKPASFQRKNRKANEVSVEDKLYASVKWLPEVKEDSRRKAVQDYIASGNDLSLFATAVDALCE